MKHIYLLAACLCGLLSIAQAGPPDYNVPIAFTPRDSTYFNGSWNMNLDVNTVPTIALTDPTWGNMTHYMASFSKGGVLTIMPQSVGHYMGLKVDKTTTVNGKALNANITLNKADIGLGNVDNTSDANKPVSTATQTALNGKFNNPSGTTAQYVRGDGSLATFPSGSRTINNNVSRSLNTNYTISSSRDAQVSYSVSLSVTNPLLAGSSTASAFLEYSTDGGSNWITISQAVNQSSVALSVTVAITLPNTQVLSGVIPANALVRVRSTTAGTASVTFNRAQEVLL